MKHLTTICIFCVALQIPIRSFASESVINLKGEQLSEVALEDARAFTVVARAELNRKRKAGEEISPELQTLADAAQSAFKRQDYYTAYRLFIRFMSLARTGRVTEASEVAASYDLRLSRTVFGPGESINVRLAPIYTLGEKLSGTYKARLYLEGEEGILEESEKNVSIDSLQPFELEFATEHLTQGTAGVRYELFDPQGNSLLNFTRAFVVSKETGQRLEKLTRQLEAIETAKPRERRPTHLAAIETVKYVTEHLAEMHDRYIGDFRGTTRPIVMNFRRGDRGINWSGPVRLPEDLDLAEQLAEALQAGNEPLTQAGDFHLAYQSEVDQKLVPYRVFVPEGYDSEESWPLILVLHGSSGSEHSWFDREPRDGGEGNPCKRLAQQRGYLVAAPSGRGPFEGYNGIGGTDLLEVMDRCMAMYNIDPERVYLTGHSLGGGGTWINGFRHAERFAAIAPIAANARWLREEHVKQRADLPVLFSQGAQDVVVLPGPSRRTAELAAKHMTTFTYNEYPNDTHSSIWHTAIESIFDFFDKH